MGKMSRDKGKIWEREVAAGLRAIFGNQVRRGWQARAGGDDPDIVGCESFWTEAKHHKVVNIGGAVKQVIKAQKVFKDMRWALVVSKSNRHEPLATMLWENFLVLLAEWWELKKTTTQVVGKLVDLKPTRAELEKVLGQALNEKSEAQQALALKKLSDHSLRDKLRSEMIIQGGNALGALAELLNTLKPLAVEINDAVDTDPRWEAVAKAYDAAVKVMEPASESPRK